MKASEIKAGKIYRGQGWSKDSTLTRKVLSLEEGFARWYYTDDAPTQSYRNLLSTFASWAREEVL